MTRPPNLVFILTDDHAAHAISAYDGVRGEPRAELHRLGRELGNEPWSGSRQDA